MRLLRNELPPYALALGVLALTLALAGCDTGHDPAVSQVTPGPSATSTTSSYTNGILRVGDKVVVDFSGVSETIQPVPQEIAADGTIKLPFIEQVTAAGKTPAQLQNDIQEAYVPRWYKHINITVATPQRFFSVGGFVNKGDRFPYTSPIKVTEAIQAAGGFDLFANKKKVQLTRVDGSVLIVNCLEVLKHPELDPPVYPGDKIDVPRRAW